MRYNAVGTRTNISNVRLTLYDYRFLRMWIIVILLFGVTSITATIAYSSVSSSFLSEQLLDKFKDMAGDSFNPFLLSMKIFINNTIVTLVSALLSITIILPLFIIAVNGIAVGFISSYAMYNTENTLFHSPYMVFYSLITHGSIEVPALSLVAAAVLFAGRNVNVIIKNVTQVIPVSIVMLLVAAVVESTLTIALILALSLIRLLI